jgi:uncharacterized ferritin-like protein (DUF455 family)
MNMMDDLISKGNKLQAPMIASLNLPRLDVVFMLAKEIQSKNFELSLQQSHDHKPILTHKTGRSHRLVLMNPNDLTRALAWG